MPELHPGRSEEAQCYNCGAPGHWAIACPEPTRETPAGLAAWRNAGHVGHGNNRDHRGGPKRARGPIITKYTPAPLPPPPPPPGTAGAGYGPPPGYGQAPVSYPGATHSYPPQSSAYSPYASSPPNYAPPYPPPPYPPQPYAPPSYGRPPHPPPSRPSEPYPPHYPTPGSSSPYPVPYGAQPPYGSSYPQPYSYGPPPPAYPPAYPPPPPPPSHSAPPTYGSPPGSRGGPPGTIPRHPPPPPRHNPPSTSPPLARGSNLPPSLPPKPPQSRRDHHPETRRDHRNKRKNDRQNRNRDNRHRKNPSNARSQDHRPHDNNRRPSSKEDTRRLDQSMSPRHEEKGLEDLSSQKPLEVPTSRLDEEEEPDLVAGSNDVSTTELGEGEMKALFEEPSEEAQPLDEADRPLSAHHTEEEVLLPRTSSAASIEVEFAKADEQDAFTQPVSEAEHLPAVGSNHALIRDGKLPSGETLTAIKQHDQSASKSETPESGEVNERRRKHDEFRDDVSETRQPKRQRSNSFSQSHPKSPLEGGSAESFRTFVDSTGQASHINSNEESHFKYRRPSYSRARSLSGSPRSRRSSISHASSGLDSLEAELLGRDVKIKASEETEGRYEHRDEGKSRIKRRRQPKLDSAYSRRW